MYDWLGILSRGPLGIIGSIIEIGLLSLAIFGIIRFMAGTRGASLGRGVVVFAAVIFLLLLLGVQLAGLRTLNVIMERVAGVAVIGLVVIFQPEIRRGFIRIGEGALHLFHIKTASLEREIADAAVALSRQGGVGGLIAIERDTGIGTFMESGLRLDAEVSSGLIRTIFSKNTPLHDGAVIISQGRLAAANCLLPLSENIEVCRGMGTRHRAAIGLTEETDAVVVVISEENGQISMAVDGTIKSGIDYDELQQLLRQHCFQVREEVHLEEGSEHE